jgi:hypothetical protein
MDIEIAHLNPRKKNKSWKIDNAIPLCFTCHQKVFSYDPNHTRGTKYTVEELKAGRDETYDKYTHHLVPEFGFEITQNSPPWYTREYPSVGFMMVLSRMKQPQPVGFQIVVTASLNGRNRGTTTDRHYSGRKIWDEPQPRSDSVSPFWGNFTSPVATVKSDQRLELRVSVTAIDKYKREHSKARSYVYVRKTNSWYPEP